MDDALSIFLMSKAKNDMVYFIISGGIVVRGAFLDWGKQALCVRIITADSNASGLQLGVTLTIPETSIVAWGEMEQ